MGKIGQGLQFAEAKQTAVRIDDANSLDVSNITVSAWVYRTSNPTDYQGVVSRQSGTGNADLWLLLYDNFGGTNNRWAFCASQCATGITGDAYLNQWIHIVGTADASATRLYINGNLIASGAGGTIAAETSKICIGGGENDATQNCIDSNNEYMDGAIDDVRIYNRALSADEIKRLYKIGATTKINVSRKDTLTDGLVGHWTFDGPDVAGVTAYDRSGQGNNGTLTSGPVRTLGKIGQGLSVNGTSAYVNAGKNSSLSNAQFTASFWVKGSSDSDTASIKKVMSKHSSDTVDANTYGFDWSHTNSAYQRACEINTVPGATFIPAKLTTVLTANKWYHIVCSYDGTNLGAYLNGNLETTIVAATPSTGNSSFFIGAGGSNGDTPGGYFDGAIDDVRIYNRALSADEIKRLYNMGK
ncbi:MAG: LamG domain-containing protein [Patescibacteria group bacterium]